MREILPPDLAHGRVIVYRGRRKRELTLSELMEVRDAMQRASVEEWRRMAPEEIEGHWYWDEGPQ